MICEDDIVILSSDINQDTEAGELRSKPVKNKPPYYESAYEIIPKCPKNEEYLSCGPDCEDECSRRCSPQNTGCKKGCFCKNGYVRHGGRCISLASCQKSKTINKILSFDRSGKALINFFSRNNMSKIRRMERMQFGPLL